jgi:hypothetical protein
MLQAPPEHQAAAAADSGLQAGTAAAAANGGSSAGGAPAYSSDFEIVVSDPVKQGEGVSAYVSYKVCMLVAPTNVGELFSWSLLTACLHGLTALRQYWMQQQCLFSCCLNHIVWIIWSALRRRCLGSPE